MYLVWVTWKVWFATKLDNNSLALITWLVNFARLQKKDKSYKSFSFYSFEKKPKSTHLMMLDLPKQKIKVPKMHNILFSMFVFFHSF